MTISTLHPERTTTAPAPAGTTAAGDNYLPGLPGRARVAEPLPCEAQPELWFSEHGHVLARAQAQCGACPVARQCLQGALERRERWGVWGGSIFVDGRIVETKRGRGRPRKQQAA